MHKGVELRNCPTVLVAGRPDFAVTGSHFVDGKPAPAGSFLALTGVPTITHSMPPPRAVNHNVALRR